MGERFKRVFSVFLALALVLGTILGALICLLRTRRTRSPGA